MWKWIIAGLVLGATPIFIFLGYRRWAWTGFGQAILPKGGEKVEIRPKKTLWDWLDLLIVPAVLAIGGLFITIDLEQQRAQLEESRAQDDALQAYIDQMGVLLLERHLGEEDVKPDVRNLARARTLTVLDSLEPERKRRVLRLLHETELINTESPGQIPAIRLRYAVLEDIRVHGPLLKGSDLKGADLSGANLAEADLSNCNLAEAYLSGANLARADLSGANLRAVKGVSLQELKSARSLEGATIPDGSKND